MGGDARQKKYKAMAKPRYQLLIEVQHQANDPDGVRRLRMALKRLLRSFGMRCVTVTREYDVNIHRVEENRDG